MSLTNVLCTCQRILRQCPFCGGDAQVDRMWFFGWSYAISCVDCEATTSVYEDEDEASSNWNLREREA